MSSDMEFEEGGLGLFTEPEDFYSKEKDATFEEHTLKCGEVVRLRLVGQSPLWGHLLWNAGRTVADYIDTESRDSLNGKYVLELGAGAGLPSVVCAANGAAKVVVTDYPDSDLVNNLRQNVEASQHLLKHDVLFSAGYVWGSSTETLMNLLPQEARHSGFHVVILADLLFNHSEHERLADSVVATLSHEANSMALVFFTPYRPWLLNKDLDFFRIADDRGFHVEKILEKVMDEVMFKDDPGDEILRRTVFGYRLTWK